MAVFRSCIFVSLVVLSVVRRVQAGDVVTAARDGVTAMDCVALLSTIETAKNEPIPNRV